MRATLDWSYTLLDEPERVLLRRLAVFAGSFRLDAAEAVCGPGPTLDALTALVGHSLVTTTAAADGPRFRLLEVVRQYAAEKLADAGEAAELAERHAAHVAMVMRVAESTLRPPVRPSDPRGATLARCEADHADLLAALQWAAGEPSRAVILAQLAASSWWFWWMCGHISTGARWMRRALDAAQARGLPDEVLVELWHGAGWLARHLGDHNEAARLLQAAHDGYVAAGDALGESVTAHRMAAVAIAVDPALAVPHLDASAAAARRARDDWALACSSYWRGVWCRVAPAAAALVPDGGVALLRRAGELFVRCGDGWAVGRTHGTLAWTLVETGMLDEAATELVQARQLGELTQDRWGLALWSVHETLLHRARGDRRRAAASAAAALAAFTALGDRHETRRVVRTPTRSTPPRAVPSPRSRSARGCTTASARTWLGQSWPRPCARWRAWARSRPTARPAGGPRWASPGRTTYPSAGRQSRSARRAAPPRRPRRAADLGVHHDNS
jgi:hypothetical protein